MRWAGVQRKLAIMLAIATLAACGGANSEDGLPIGGPLPGAGAIFPRMTTLRDQKFVNVVHQENDFSCGAAALATLLKYAYGMDVTEHQVFSGMYAMSDQALVRKRGFSLLDIRNYVLAMGLQADGYRIPPPALERVKVPVIVLLNLNGYEHFVVMRKATPNAVYVADPELGNRAMPPELFYKDWQFGVILAVIGKNYDKNNPLVTVEKTLNTNEQARSLIPAFNPLTAQVLATISVIPGQKL
jgi:predicted double-glycine peptidase